MATDKVVYSRLDELIAKIKDLLLEYDNLTDMIDDVNSTTTNTNAAVNTVNSTANSILSKLNSSSIISIGSVIKSIQRGSGGVDINLRYGATNIITWSPVNLTKSIVLFDYSTSFGGGGSGASYVTPNITSTGIVVNSTYDDRYYLHLSYDPWTVIEFY